MLRYLTLLLTVVGGLSAAPIMAEDAPVLRDVIDNHILPRFTVLNDTTAQMDAAAQSNCAPDDTELREAYHAAFDAWIAASHLRFGPTEEENRGFAMGFWPDPKGFTTKSLGRFIQDEDPIVQDPTQYAEVSIAARGFYAMEALLYDEWINDQGSASSRCALVRAVAHDIARTAQALNTDWTGAYLETFATVGPEQLHETQESAVQVLLNALDAGYQFTEEARLGRPLGTFERPRPKRAEARRSKRSLRNVAISLTSLTDLALRLSADDPDLQEIYTAGLQRAETEMEDLSPIFAGVASTESRLKVEILQQEVQRMRETTNTLLAEHWGVAVGFNALDGD